MAASVAVAPPAGEFVRALVPEWAVPLFLLVTRLGNVGFVLGLLVLDYWIGDHERGAHAVAIGVGGLALITALKAFFGAPRPPSSVNVVPTSGYSFPSGHALAATVGYGILALDLRIGSWRARYAVATTTIALVALSRVVLGVHFVRDVLGGVLVGVGFLGLARFVTDDDPRRGFLLAAGIGVVAVIVSAASRDGVAVLGATLGAFVCWEVIDAVPSVDATPRRLALVAVGLPLLGGLGYVATVPPLPDLAVFALNAVLFAVVIAAPRVVAEV